MTVNRQRGVDIMGTLRDHTQRIGTLERRTPVSTSGTGGVSEAYVQARTRFSPLNFGGTPGGGDSQAAIQAALTAAAEDGGGTVDLLGAPWTWDGDLLIPDNTWLVSAISNIGASNALTALSTDARIRLGDWDTNDRPGGLGYLSIDGNGLGHADGLVQVEGVTTAMEHVTIANAAGHGLYLNGAQNIHFDSVDVFESANGGVVLDNGAGGCLWSRCSIRGNEIGVWITDGPGTNVYPFGPAHNEFNQCIVEAYDAVTALIKIECGGNNLFNHVGISANNVTVADDALVTISNPHFPGIGAYAEFGSCNFNGGSENVDGIRVFGSNVAIVHGHTYRQHHTIGLLVADGGTPFLRQYGDMVTGTTPGEVFGTVNGGSLLNTYAPHYTNMDFRLPTTHATALTVRRDTDGNTGYRGRIDRDLTIHYDNGTGFGSKQSMSYKTSNDRILLTSIETGGVARVAPAAATPGNAAAVTTDVKAASMYKYLLVGTGSIASWTLSNATDGARLTILLARTAAQTVVWPTNVRWNANTAPTLPTAGNWLVLELVYEGTVTNLWLEVSRSTVPSS